MRPIIHEACMFVDGIHTMKREKNRESCRLHQDEYPDLLEALGKRRAVFIKNHGVIVVDDSPIHLVMSAIFLRKNAVALFKSSLIGEPIYIDNEAASRSAQETVNEDIADRIWKYCLQRVRRNMPDLYW
jgi:HCOMODA/2-hydroxy-3-carboxy-muconic semialdehyde decarboxylase